MRCSYCKEKLDAYYETIYAGEDDEHEWVHCCGACAVGDWYYLEDDHGNVLIEEDGNLHHYEGDEDAD